MKKNCLVLQGFILLTISCLLVTSCQTQPDIVSAPTVTSVDIIDYGVYEAPVKSIKLAESIQGTAWKTDMEKAKFTLRSNKIPAVLGTRFGFSYKVTGSPVGAEVILNHRRQIPKFKNIPPKYLENYQKRLGRPYTGFHLNDGGYQVHRKIGKIYSNGFSFDEDFELEPGTYIFQVVYEGRVMAEMSFQVYLP